MHRPIARRARALVLLPVLAAAAACQDETPTLSGDDLFPGGERPQTLEVVVPASQYLTLLGVYTGFADRNDLGTQVVANGYEGVLNAHTLVRPSFPRTVTYSQDGASREDSVYSLRGATLTLLVDSAATDAPGATVRVFDLAQGFEFGTVSWTVASDTGATVPWAVPGGTPGPLVGEATYQPGTAGDSINVALDSVGARRLREGADSSGVLVRVAQAGSRLELRNAILTARVRPSNAVRDTTLEINIPLFATFVYTPEPPRSPGRLEAGGVRAARSIFSIDLDRTVPGCAPGETCAAVPLSEVLVNRVSLVLRPVSSPAGFEPLGTVPLTLWTVTEPELGARAPLGELVNDAFVTTGPVATYEAGVDDEVEVPFTAYAVQAVRADSLPTTFALLGETPPVSGSPDRNFGVSVFESEPRLRIVYTLPIRPRLP